MSAEEEQGASAAVEEQPEEISSDIEETEGYKVPEKKETKQVLEQDKDDEALVRYKEELLKDAKYITGEPHKVIVKKMTLISTSEDFRKEVDLSNVATEKLPTIKIKEGISYKIEFEFIVENDIVTGLRYHHVVKRKGVRVDKESHMLGSYGPKPEPHSITIAENEMPKGMIARGHYSVTSKIVDDDKVVHLEWNWSFDLNKDW
ncbi:rho GDP-dissociation inhibitor 1-like [Convolutriloba macropyga]|uniref:rho GDP-dissociation inhibitor 1-like n=1 Tax=Convolutriloba macropyga TaxID=536237 RepID=UPI003F524B04